MIARLSRIFALIFTILLAPLAMVVAASAVLSTDILFKVFGRGKTRKDRLPKASSASVVIPNWNGRDLLEKYLPSVVAALSDHPGNEVIVVDNGSTDGSADFVRAAFPSVRLLELPRNLGFGGGSNAGVKAALNDIIVLLNSDMRVDRGFLSPLLQGFTDEKVFAVSCQIFFTDPNKKREETGLTQADWVAGRLRVRHRLDPQVDRLFPCFYGGGGSCAFDRTKFLELGGFDSIYHPFYLEDTDLGYLAWKRGWTVLYQPASIVFHEHRGTIGAKFSTQYIQSVIQKNFLLFTWKNVHSWRMLLAHTWYTLADASVSAVAGHSPERASVSGLWQAVRQIHQLAPARWRSLSLAVISDAEAFLRPLPGYFYDRFHALPKQPDRLSVLFVSPYPICPPTHGGGVFMYQTARELASRTHLHLLVLLDHEWQKEAHASLEQKCASAEYFVRMTGHRHTVASGIPHAVSEFKNSDLLWSIHRQIFLNRIDVVQLEYMPLGQYAQNFRQIPCILFEHDLYFQSIARQWSNMRNPITRLQAAFEYLRGLHYELSMLRKPDRIQVCSQANADYLLSFSPSLKGLIDSDLRAGIAAADYPVVLDGREPQTLLFMGSFRHAPNMEALQWFARFVMPIILRSNPAAKLIVVGSDQPPAHSLPHLPPGALELKGFVPDILEPLRQYAVFVCPILSGSGVRVKLLEAFASGIPVVSTRLGAEGLAEVDREIARLADEPQTFAAAVVDLLDNFETGRDMAMRAREYVLRERNMATMTAKLEKNYRQAVSTKRAGV